MCFEGVGMKHRISEFFAGLLFGVGLILAGMTDPGKVLGFLDVFGAWDPSLALVMGGRSPWVHWVLRWLKSEAPIFLAVL
jgi:20S proteasome alpha/beta subunit